MAEDPEDEVVRLRRQVAELEHEVEHATGARERERGPRAGRWRPVVCVVLVVIAALLAPLAVVAVWTHDQVSDTDRYVETVAPLASNPAVQRVIIDRITTEVVDRIDVRALTKQAVDALAAQGLPPVAAATLSSLASPLADQISSVVRRGVARIVYSPGFAQAWINANRVAHGQLVDVLTGKQGNEVEASGNSVRVNLAAVIATVKQQLVGRGFALASRIPEVNAQFTIIESGNLSKAQGAFRLLGTLAYVLPLLVLALLAASVALARSRRRAVVFGALAIAVSMVLLGLALSLVRTLYLNNVSTRTLPVDAATAVYDTLVHFIRVSLRSLLVLFLAIAAIAWVSGPTEVATVVRRGLSRSVGTIRQGLDRVGLRTGRLGTAASTYRTPARIVILGGALVVYVMASRPTAGFAVLLLVIALVLLLVLEVLARGSLDADPAPEQSLEG